MIALLLASAAAIGLTVTLLVSGIMALAVLLVGIPVETARRWRARRRRAHRAS